MSKNEDGPYDDKAKLSFNPPTKADRLLPVNARQIRSIETIYSSTEDWVHRTKV